MSNSPPSIDELLRALPHILAELQALRAENAKIMQSSYDPEKIRTIAHTAAYMSTTEGAIRSLIKRGELKSLQIGNKDHVAQSAIHEWIERSHTAQENRQYRQKLAEKGSQI